MKEKVMILIYKDGQHITSQDVTGFRADQIAANVKVKEEAGYNCRIKRYPADYDIQAETGINANDFLKGRCNVLIVKAESVKDYLAKYYKKDRMTPTLWESYQEEYDRRGFVTTSHHDNVIGELIAWPYYPNHKGVQQRK